MFSYAPRRLNLLVVPPETDAVGATRLMAEAASPANTMTASDLLAAETGGGAPGPRSRSAFLPSAVAPSGGAGEAGRRPTHQPTRVGGHGLFIVDRLALCWGSLPNDGGKAVWTELLAPSGQPPPSP